MCEGEPVRVMINPALPNNRKLWRLAADLKMTDNEALGCIVRLWCCVIQQAEDGVLRGWTSKEIARSAGWEKDPFQFVEALVKHGWLEKTTDGHKVHDWVEHQGDIIARRKADRDRKRKAREESERSPNGFPSESAAPIPSPPSPSVPVQNKKSSSISKSKGTRKSKVVGPASSKAGAVPDDLKGLELYEKDAKLCEAWTRQKSNWVLAFPGVDIVAEVRKAHAWEMANPTKQKIRRVRFLNSWLSRAQDKPGAPQTKSPADIYREVEEKEAKPNG